MPEIRSSIGSRSVRGGKTFTVSDDSEIDEVLAQQDAARNDIQQEEDQKVYRGMEEISAMRNQRVRQNNRASENARRRIEMLVGIGRAKRDVPVETEEGKMVLSMRTLKGTEMKALADLTTRAAQGGNAGAIYDIRNVTLAFVIFKIDGVDIDIVLDCADEPNKYDIHKVEFLDQLDESVLTYLYREYQVLSKENQRRFGVNSEAEAKEVVADMSKSSTGT